MAQESSQLQLTVYSARFCKSASTVGVEIRLGEQILKTKNVVVDASEEANWSETFLFTGTTLQEIYKLSLDVKLARFEDSDRKEVGYASIPINRLPINQEIDTWFVIESSTSLKDEEKPQIRLGFVLSGQLRPEIKKLLNFLGVYTSLVDQGIERVSSVGQKAKPYLMTKAAAAAAVPLGGVFLASIPFLLIASPLLFPIIAVAGAGVAVIIFLIGILTLSSKVGRSRLAPYVEDAVRKLRSDAAGQQFLYATGPRPSMIPIIRLLAPEDRWPKLIASLVIDFVGCLSYAVPVLGEMGDIVWAPISAVLIDSMYNEKVPYAAYVGFVEEILPFTDIIPTATLAWLREYLPEIIMQSKEGRSRAAEAAPEPIS